MNGPTSLTSILHAGGATETSAPSAPLYRSWLLFLAGSASQMLNPNPAAYPPDRAWRTLQQDG